jgi:arylsulfatase A-like enzyme
MLLNPAVADGPMVSTRQGHCGDILPTLADLAGLPVPEVPGKSLGTLQREARPVFFFTLFGTDQWGLRDGQWKFIQGIEDRIAELFDLSRDPTEQANLAARHPDRVREYELRCQQWFLRANDDFRARLCREIAR